MHKNASVMHVELFECTTFGRIGELFTISAAYIPGDVTLLPGYVGVVAYIVILFCCTAGFTQCLYGTFGGYL